MPPTPYIAVVGTQQSPMLIEKAKTFRTEFSEKYFSIDYTGTVRTGNFSEHDLVFDEGQRESLTFEGEIWHLRKIHIHTPIEHKIDTMKTPPTFECHLVHFRDDDLNGCKNKLVLAVYLAEKASYKSADTFKNIAKALKNRSNKSTECPMDVILTDFVPADVEHNVYHYQGSLTTEPYTEDVTWFVLPTEVQIKKGDLERLKEHEQEAREPQRLNRRFILRNFD